MGANYDPDESAILDLGIFRRGLIQRLGADGLICEHDMAVIRAFDEPHRELGRRLKVRQAFDSVMRNGVTRRTSDRAREAGLALIVTDGQPCDVIVFPGAADTIEAS